MSSGNERETAPLPRWQGQFLYQHGRLPSWTGGERRAWGGAGRGRGQEGAASGAAPPRAPSPLPARFRIGPVPAPQPGGRAVGRAEHSPLPARWGCWSRAAARAGLLGAGARRDAPGRRSGCVGAEAARIAWAPGPSPLSRPLGTAPPRPLQPPPLQPPPGPPPFLNAGAGEPLPGPGAPPSGVGPGAGPRAAVLLVSPPSPISCFFSFFGEGRVGLDELFRGPR